MAQTASSPQDSVRQLSKWNLTLASQAPDPSGGSSPKPGNLPSTGPHQLAAKR